MTFLIEEAGTLRNIYSLVRKRFLSPSLASIHSKVLLERHSILPYCLPECHRCSQTGNSAHERKGGHSLSLSHTLYCLRKSPSLALASTFPQCASREREREIEREKERARGREERERERTKAIPSWRQEREKEGPSHITQELCTKSIMSELTGIIM